MGNASELLHLMQLLHKAKQRKEGKKRQQTSIGLSSSGGVLQDVQDVMMDIVSFSTSAQLQRNESTIGTRKELRGCPWSG